jgi:hypothetical protein
LDRWPATHEMEYFLSVGRNGGNGDRRLKSKSDNAGKSLRVTCNHNWDPPPTRNAYNKLAASPQLMLRSSIEGLYPVAVFLTFPS